MVASTSIEVSHSVKDGWHIFEAVQMPGLYVAHTDPRIAFGEVSTAIEKLVMLDTGMKVLVAPEMAFSDFIGSVRSSLTAAAALQRFNLFKDAA